MFNSKRVLLLALILLCAAGLTSAQEDDHPRPFLLGFTPFPYDISIEAVIFSYQTIATDADLIAHHFDDGIPWPEALSGEPYSPELMEEWQTRLDNTSPGHQIYLAITPITIQRAGLAWYRGAEGDMPLPPPWDSYDFNHPDVKTAFLNHAVNAVEFFDPDFLAIGIEVNLLLDNSPEQWDAYVELHQYVYTELKGLYPDLPVFVSVVGLHMLEGYVDETDPAAQREVFLDIADYTDIFALSIYPYMTRYLAGDLPETMFDDLFSLSDKPIAIAETGYPAQSFSIWDGALTFEGSPEKQDAYFTGLLQAAQEREFVFVVNFVLRDYDALWEKIGGGDLNSLWRDTGFYDEDGVPRPVLETWRSYLAQPYVAP